MSAAAERAGRAAVAEVLERMAALAMEAPAVRAERVDDMLRLAGPGLAIRMVEDVRLRALAAQASR